MCQLCGCWYETRKGLSSHARAHLRQIGISDSDIEGSPIDYLYKIIKDEHHKPASIDQQTPLTSNSPTASSSKRPSDLSSTPECPSKKRSKASEKCTCVLCGEEFENRKGLASHARSHLRQIGVIDLLGKSSAINTVQELVNSGVLQASKTDGITRSSAEPSVAPGSSPDLSSSSMSLSSTSLCSSPAKTTPSLRGPGNKAPKAKKGFRLAVDPLNRKPKPEPVEVEVSAEAKAPSTIDSPIQKSPTAVASDPLNAGKVINKVII